MKASREIRDLVLGNIYDFFNGDSRAIDVMSTADAAVFIGSDPREFWEGGHQVRALLARQIEEIARVNARISLERLDPTEVRILVHAVRWSTAGSSAG